MDFVRKLKVLVVDDEKHLADLVGFHMKRAGYDVVLAGDGEQALKVSREEKPDLLILDLMLPKINGWEVCKCLRRDLSRTVRVIMLSARAELDDKRKGFYVGADDYMTKPFSPRDLVAKVNHMLKGQEGNN
jgi:two-component system, OmpR family, alkaline phosphatase synthesis response regulator PhoP